MQHIQTFYKMAEKKGNKDNNPNRSLEHEKSTCVVSPTISPCSESSKITKLHDSNSISSENAQPDAESGSLESLKKEEAQVMIGPESPDQLIIDAVSPEGKYCYD